MLDLKNITKKYTTGDYTQTALNKVSVSFRESEFVSILGPSGSGKTTMLNIIGGLDKYTSGDLIINGISTKKYKDHDWDIYRNHRVGFVFQSYNLIGHQTVLANVELALTLSGVDKKTRRKKAIEVLKQVGLEKHMHKKPNQMSGGQMQRVAIARALINDPDILLCDEPTGALDSETSIQIMEIIKGISKNKLVVMVTHNPELAHEYSSRIISIADGEITNDTNPYDGNKEATEDAKTTKKKSKKTSMNHKTAFSLSLNNLMTKKGRTLLTSIAGSIGIIGIALILSISNGVNNYINRVQEDTLTNYPLSIEQASIDMTSMMSAMAGKNESDHEQDAVYSNNIMSDMISTITSGITTNNMVDFKKYIEDNKSEFDKYSNGIKYRYNLDLQIYANDTKEGINQLNPSTIFNDIGMSQMMNSMTMSGTQTNMFTEMTDNKSLRESQYQVLAGSMPTSSSEVVLLLDENNEISDYALYSIGLLDKSDLRDIMQAVTKGEEIDTIDQAKFTYDDIIGTTFKVVLNSDYYEKSNGVWVNKQNDESYMKKVINNSLSVKVVGIIKPSDDSNASTTGEILYTSELTKYVIDGINSSKIVKEQEKDETTNVLTNQKFDTSNTYETVDTVYSTIGKVDLDNPSGIDIYPKSFSDKSNIEDLIKEYNEKVDEEDEIEYTDYVGMLMSGVTTIINVIGYVLIAFVSISLVVSSIMIGIITYISVLERTKEIGILRAIGASKKDISRVFNAETFIIGACSGTIGILITIILNVGITQVIRNISGVNVTSVLGIIPAIVLIAISVLLTVIAGLIPSKVASKKDPVIALRTE